MEISDNIGWIIMPKSQPSALNLHPDLHALHSIPPQQIPKSWQSVALSLGPILIHLASPHYWTGRYNISWTLCPSRNWISSFISLYVLFFNIFTSLFSCKLFSLRWNRCKLIFMWSNLNLTAASQGKRGFMLSSSSAYLTTTGIIIWISAMQGKMQNEESYRLQGDALTASLMWVEYVRSFCICVCVCVCS